MLASPPNDHAPPSRTQFAGHIIVFAGRLSSIGRREACALVEHLGGTAAAEVTARTTMLVVGDEDRDQATTEKSYTLERAEAVNAKVPGQVQILSEEEFCRLGGLRSAAFLRQRYHGCRQLRELYPLVHESRLRYLSTWGLIRPVARTKADTYYSFADVAVIKQVHDDLNDGRSFRAAVRRQLAQRDGQLALDFGSVHGDARPAKVVAIRRRASRKMTSAGDGPEWFDSDNPQAAIAARFFLEGSELDEGSDADQERARTAYRKALLLDPHLVPAIVNLANLHYAHDDLVEAQALYARALSLDPDCFEAHFNLGNIHHDLGRYDDALDYYNDALRLNPTYADAHFYLAVTLEKMGRSPESKPHWRAYQTLAPDGDWVDLAREFSE
jgi:Tfp pilus assembly protein PilF